MATYPASRAPDPSDGNPRLSGSIHRNGIEALKADALFSRPPSETSSSKSNGNTVGTNTPEVSIDTEGEDELEDYDMQKPDEGAIIQHSHGGILDGANASLNGKRKSIPMRLEKTEQKGRYMLRADDLEVQEILKRGLARQSAAENGKRTGVRDLVFTRRFTTFDRQNPLSYESPFQGFFTLFWLSMLMIFIRVAAYNWRQHGSILGRNEVLEMMLSHDVLILGLTDGAMCASTLLGLVLQRLILRGWLSWEGSGYIIQNLWQTFYLACVVGWTFYREWPWTHTVFTVLHAMVFLMKQHSYAFYNGYLSQVYRRKQLLERKQKQLEAMSPVSTPSNINSPTAAFTSAYFPPASPTDPRHRRKSSLSSSTPSPANLSVESEQLSSITSAISASQSLTTDQMAYFSQIISEELAALTTELKGKCTTTTNHYPYNLNLSDFALWTCFPTLVYELEYPRQDRINWWYVAEKTAATFGVIGMMMAISQAYIYPPVTETLRMKEAGMPIAHRWAEFPWIVSDMLFPLLLEQLLTWYVIWECILNVLAEVTRFADRGFYGDWWNSVSWDQYARDWNRPVHNFLLRHVYHSSISAFRLSKTAATFATFLLSACVHELVMFCMFKKVRGYLFATQLLQLPLAALSRTRLMRGRRVLGNVVFWVGLFVGPSFITCLYLVV